MSKKHNYITKLAYVHKKLADPYNNKAYIDLEIFVPKPTRDNPLPCILVSIRNGHAKLFFRLRDIADFVKGFSISRREKERMKLALIEANVEADEIEQDFKLLFERRRLKPGTKIVNGDTGEILGVAERLLKENQYQYKD